MENFKSFVEQQESGLIKLYHGGSMWETTPQYFPAKKGRYEGGNGIYLTTSYETARKYAKGSKIVLAVYVKPDYKKIWDVLVPVQEMIDFLSSIRMKNKKKVIDAIKASVDRQNKTVLPAAILNNLIVNFEAGSGEAGVLVNQFLVSKGVDAEVTNKGAEDWLVVFNPRIIVKWEKVKPSEMKPQDYHLPQII